MLTMKQLCNLLHKTPAELNAELIRVFQIRQPSVSQWWKHIPLDRQVAIVEMYKLSPSLLVGRGRSQKGTEHGTGISETGNQ